MLNDATKPTHVAIYVDTSGSMYGSIPVANAQNESRGIKDFLFAGAGKINREKWDVVMEIWSSIQDHVSPMPLTLRTINSKHDSKTLLEVGSYSHSVLSNTPFPTLGGGTYLWEFLADEGVELLESSEQWMFILISDGMDGESSHPYSGIEGFRPCVEKLQQMNIDTEFHIIGLGLPSDACEVFRQVSGSTGGVFYNLGGNREDESIISEAVENLIIAIDEAVDPALRARSRRRRQAEYLEGCADGDLTIIEIPSSVPDLVFDSEGVYARLGIQELNPDSMDLWGSSFLSLSGHTAVRTESSNHWLKSVSHSRDHRFESTLRGTWTLDASELSQIARSNLDAMFELTNQIKYSPIPVESRSIIIRGTSVNFDVLNIVRSTGARIVILPADLPSPPIGWDETQQFLLAGEIPFNKGGWSMAPTSHSRSSRAAVLFDIYNELDIDSFSETLELDDIDKWSSTISPIPDEYLKYLKSSSWKRFGIDEGIALDTLVIQFKAIVKYICTSLRIDTRVFIIRPDETLMQTLDKEKKFQIEFLNRIDDFLILHSKKHNTESISVDYWPTLSQ
jgi:hypothetical protein